MTWMLCYSKPSTLASLDCPLLYFTPACKHIPINHSPASAFFSCAAAKTEQHMKSEVPVIIEFANSIGRDANMDDTVVRNCINLLGDICSTVPSAGPIFQQARNGDWEKLVGYCNDSGHLLSDTEWAINTVSNACGVSPAALAAS